MVDRCVCCGEIVPEGRMVCLGCEANTKKEENPLWIFPLEQPEKISK